MRKAALRAVRKPAPSLEPVIEKLQDEIRQLRNGHAASESTEE